MSRLIAAFGDLFESFNVTFHTICFFILPVVGHGIALHGKDGGNDRLGCANITADSSLFVEKFLEYKKEDEFSR